MSECGAGIGRTAPAFRLANLTTITEAGVTLDLEYLAASLPRDTKAAASKSITSFLVPEDATWDELKLWDRCPQIEVAPSPVILVPAMAPRRLDFEYAAPADRIVGCAEFREVAAAAVAAGEDEFAVGGELQKGGAVGEVGAGAADLEGWGCVLWAG